MEPRATARAYYEAIDAADYERLASLLAADFRHERPDRTIEGREAFVRFMREGRPRTDTSHEIVGVFPDGRTADSGDEGSARVAVEGRLLDAEGVSLFGFVDVFAIADGAVDEIRTFTNGRPGEQRSAQ